MSVDILVADWHDVRALKELDRRCFLPEDAFGYATYLRLCLQPGIVRLKAVADARVVGFIAAEPRVGGEYANIVSVGVDPAWRRQGIGEKLMLDVERQVTTPRLRLQVRKTNAAAIRLYRRLGYAIIGDLPGYYGDADGYLMEKTRKA